MSNSLDDISALKDDFRMQSPETSAPTSSVDVFVRIMAVIVINLIVIITIDIIIMVWEPVRAETKKQNVKNSS